MLSLWQNDERATMSGILYSPALLLTLVHHCDSSPRSKSQKFIWMQKLYNAKGGKQHQRMHIYKKTTHVSNHTLALTVSTEIYCTLEMDVQQKRQGKKNGCGCASSRKMLKWLMCWKTKMQWHESTSITECCVFGTLDMLYFRTFHNLFKHLTYTK